MRVGAVVGMQLSVFALICSLVLGPFNYNLGFLFVIYAPLLILVSTCTGCKFAVGTACCRRCEKEAIMYYDVQFGPAPLGIKFNTNPDTKGCFVSHVEPGSQADVAHIPVSVNDKVLRSKGFPRS